MSARRTTTAGLFRNRVAYRDLANRRALWRNFPTRSARSPARPGHVRLDECLLDSVDARIVVRSGLGAADRAKPRIIVREAIACDPMGATIEFGAPRDRSLWRGSRHRRACAIPSLLKQVRHAGASVTLIAVGVLIP